MTVATAAVDGALARQLRTRTAEVIAGAKAYDVPALCTRLGLASGDEAEAMGSKFKYAHSRLMTIAVERLLPIAKTLLAEDADFALDRQSNRLHPVTNAHLVCRILLEKTNIPNYT